jgi:heme/copper-type cytochrome/quinol oxidase subunit 2
MANDPRIPAFGPAPFFANPTAPRPAPLQDTFWRNFIVLMITFLVIFPLVAAMTIGFVRAAQAPDPLQHPTTTTSTCK